MISGQCSGVPAAAAKEIEMRAEIGDDRETKGGNKKVEGVKASRQFFGENFDRE